VALVVLAIALEAEDKRLLRLLLHAIHTKQHTASLLDLLAKGAKEPLLVWVLGCCCPVTDRRPLNAITCASFSWTVHGAALGTHKQLG
jgi:hypothetical protein